LAVLFCISGIGAVGMAMQNQFSDNPPAWRTMLACHRTFPHVIHRRGLACHQIFYNAN